MTRSQPDWRTSLGPCLNALESDLLPRWIVDRRWYQAKSRGIAGVLLVDGITLWSTDGLALVIAFAEVQARDGGSDLYQIPLVISHEDPGPVAESARIGRLQFGDVTYYLLDGLAVPAVVLWYLNQITGGFSTQTEQAWLTGGATKILSDLMGATAPEPIRLSGAEQSHSNVIFGDQLLLKVFRKLDAGTNPDLEIGQFLTEQTGFRSTPRLAGSVTYQRVDGLLFATAMLQEFVPSRGQGWEWMLGLIGHALDAATGTEPDCESRSMEALGLALSDARLLGQRTAEFHTAIACTDDDPEFCPEPFGIEDWQNSRQELLAQVGRTRTSLAHSNQAPAALRAEADTVLAAILDWLKEQDQLPLPAGAGQKIRVHGDYHLGQTLRTESDYILLDFEGEPSKPIESRRRKQSPLRDVAGMIRSFDYAVYAAFDKACQNRPHQMEQLQQAARRFSPALIQAFKNSYQQHSDGSTWSPGGLGRDLVLGRLLLEKGIYELDYELNNRPDWASIPLRGLRELVMPSA